MGAQLPEAEAISANALSWSGCRLSAMSISPFSSSSRCEPGSGTWRMTTRFVFAKPRW